MAKPAVTRKKTVMQDVHPDIEARIEDFTDPEKIAKARERIIDYAKVAEQFAATADLPDDDGDDSLDLGTAQQGVPATPVVVPVSQSDLDDLDLLNDLEDAPSSTAPIATQRLDEDDDNGDSGYEDDLDAIFADLKDEKVVEPVVPASTRTFEDDFDDLDNDLLNDDSEGALNTNSGLGEDAYAPTTDEDDGEDFFGIPSVNQTPTPYGNVNTQNSKEDDIEDIFGIPSADHKTSSIASHTSDDDLEAMLNSQNAARTERKSPAWLEDDEDEDIPDIMPIGHAADTDSQENDIFTMTDDVDVHRTSGTTDTHPVITSSPAALNDLMSLDKDEPAPAAETTTPVVIPVIDTVSEEKPKKGFMGMFGKKKKVTDKTVTTVEDTESGMVEETVVETAVVENEVGDSVVEETETVTVKQKRNPAKIAALFAIAVGVLASGGYYVTTMMGGTTPVQTEVVDQERNFPAIGGAPTVEDIQADEPEALPLPQDAQPTDVPLVIEPEDVAPVETDTPDPVITDEAPTDPDTTDPVLPTDVNNVDAVGPVQPVDAEAEDDGSIATDVDMDADAVTADAFENLYGSGVSETEITQEQTTRALSQMGELSTLLTEQKNSLDAALNRVQTLEAIMAERDAALASAQTESELARQAAQEAKDMAMAQNKILIEVVGIRDKMQIAEELIVDLSQRTALIESDDAQAGEIRQLNERIGEMSRDIGLLARTVLTSGQNLADQQAAQAAADRAYENAQSAVDAQTEATLDRQTTAAPEGSGAVYDNERRLMTVPEPGEIPNDVKVGDVLDGFGEVLDITQMEDGSRLVIMENDSKILPRE